MNRILSATARTLPLVIFFLVSEILCNYCMKLERVNGYDNTPYNAHAVFFHVHSTAGDHVDLCEVVEEGTLRGCALLKYNEDNDVFNEVIYCDTKTIEVSGAEGYDFNAGNKSAVIGCDSSYVGKSSILIKGTEYPVRGILSKHISSAINKGVFYCNGSLSEVSMENACVLTARDERTVLAGYERLKEILAEKNVEVKRIELNRARFTDYFDNKGVIRILVFMLLLFCAAVVAAVRCVWLKLHHPEIYVLNVLGDTNIKCKVIVRYVLTWVGAYVGSAVLFLTLYHDVYRDLMSVFTVASVILVMGLLSAIHLFKEQKYVM